ncbi:unnamed protein product [Haemonchus placei]|uniref:DDE_3 domain-containing protein n=1 Tax=Haemonchus placei TaxID=6290 RepID=A0A0N4W3F0_HAEPC|nr:unnamed protein product [Haemonchus placei]
MTGRTHRDMMVYDVLPWAQQKMPDGWILQQDNDPKHTSGVVKTAFNERNVRFLDWPSHSPGRNPIEHVREELGGCVPRGQPEIGMRNLLSWLLNGMQYRTLSYRDSPIQCLLAVTP